MDSKRLKLASSNDIPENHSIIVMGPGGMEIALFKKDGCIYALDNTCPHDGGPLGEGELEGTIVTCPWHGWQFDLNTGECCNMPGENAAKVPIEVIDNDIYLLIKE